MNYLKTIDETQDGGINRVNMEYLQKKHNAKVRVKMEIFDKILNRCYNRIDISSDCGDQYCFYCIPEYIYGFPTFNTKSCAAYIMKKLMGNGFHVKFFKPNMIYIYWYYKSSPNCITPLMNIPFNPELSYPDSFNNEPRQTSLHSLHGPPIEEPNTLISIPMKREGCQRQVNIPLPPINFEHCSGKEIRDILPPHKSNLPERELIDLPTREVNFNGGNLGGNDFYSLSPNKNLLPPINENFRNSGLGSKSESETLGISFSQKTPKKSGNGQKNYRSIDEYRPSGNFLYNRR